MEIEVKRFTQAWIEEYADEKNLTPGQVVDLLVSTFHFDMEAMDIIHNAAKALNNVAIAPTVEPELNSECVRFDSLLATSIKAFEEYLSNNPQALGDEFPIDLKKTTNFMQLHNHGGKRVYESDLTEVNFIAYVFWNLTDLFDVRNKTSKVLKKSERGC